MQWDVAHQRGAGFVVTPLLPAAVFTVLYSLHEHPHLKHAEILTLLAAAAEQDTPLVGTRDRPDNLRKLLRRLRDAKLVVQCVDEPERATSRYEISRLGADMLRWLSPVTAWALNEFDRVVAGKRWIRSLPPLGEPAPWGSRQPRIATDMALHLLGGKWSFPVMCYIDSAGAEGISPTRLQITINDDIAASAGADRVQWRLTEEMTHHTLWRLIGAGLVERHEDWPQVRYCLSPLGAGLMGALWQVSEDAMSKDAELFEVMIVMSGWFPDASS